MRLRMTAGYHGVISTEQGAQVRDHSPGWAQGYGENVVMGKRVLSVRRMEGEGRRKGD